VTEELQASAILAALNAQDAHAYDIDDLKALPAPPKNYTEVTVSRRYGGQDRLPGSTGRVGWRVTTRQVGATVTAARTLRQRAVTALLYQRLTIDGVLTTPIQFESEDPISEDDSWFSGLVTWTYVT